MYMNIYIHVYIFDEVLFSKTRPPKLALAVQTRFLDWRLLPFGKELFICGCKRSHRAATCRRSGELSGEVLGLNPGGALVGYTLRGGRASLLNYVTFTSCEYT